MAWAGGIRDSHEYLDIYGHGNTSRRFQCQSGDFAGFFHEQDTEDDYECIRRVTKVKKVVEGAASKEDDESKLC